MSKKRPKISYDEIDEVQSTSNWKSNTLELSVKMEI